MPYTPTDWEDFPSVATAITAARLDNMETGIDLAVGLSEGAVPAGVVDAKGDLIVATAADTVSRLPVGANTTVLVADSTETTGLEWTSDLPVASLAPGTAGQILTTTSGVPTWSSPSAGETSGVIKMWPGAAAPTGYLLCDGSAVSRTGQAALFAICGTTYGAGDGSTTFNIPDMRGRFPVGLGTHADVNALSDSDGLAVASRTPKPSHTHTVTTIGNDPRGNLTPSNLASSGQVWTTSATIPAPGYATLNFIIKT